MYAVVIVVLVVVVVGGVVVWESVHVFLRSFVLNGSLEGSSGGAGRKAPFSRTCHEATMLVVTCTGRQDLYKQSRSKNGYSLVASLQFS